MKLYWQLTRYLRQNSPRLIIPKGALVAFGENDIGLVFPGTDGQAPVYDSTSAVGLTAGTVTGGAGGTTFDQLAPAATAKGQLLMYTGTTWAANGSPSFDGLMLRSANVTNPGGWQMVPANPGNIPTPGQKDALAGNPGSPSATNLYLTEDAIGSAVQAWDADLDGLSALSGTGFVVRTGTATYTVRSLTAGAGITITNVDGVSGSPTIAATATTGGSGGGGPGYEKTKPADQGVTSRLFGIQDTDMTIGSLPAGMYQVFSAFYFRAHATPDFACALSHTALAGVTLAYSWQDGPAANNPLMLAAGTSVTQATATPSGAFPNNGFGIHLIGTLWIHTGLTSDLYGTWGQAITSSTLAATLHRGSFIRAIPLILY